jgi:hypothetical protein
MAEIIFYSIAFYLAYRLIFDLIIPVFKTSRQMKQKFTDIHRNGPGGNGSDFPNQPGTKTGKKKAGVGEYIDFEEIK